MGKGGDTASNEYIKEKGGKPSCAVEFFNAPKRLGGVISVDDSDRMFTIMRGFPPITVMFGIFGLIGGMGPLPPAGGNGGPRASAPLPSQE